jgi:hypothetical protein
LRLVMRRKKSVAISISTDAMRVGTAIRNWSAFALVFVAPAVYAAWIVVSDGQMIHPIDVGAAAAPWACLSMSMLGATLAIVGLIERPAATAEEAVLWTALVFAVLEVPVFFVTMIGVAVGIGAPA